MKQSAATITKRGTTRRAHLDGLVATMHAEYYQQGRSLAEVARRHGYACGSCVRALFSARGLAFRETWRSRRAHAANGCFARAPLLTDAETNALADAATDLRVPAPLKLTWRKWSLERRAAHLARIRARLGPMNARPTTPYSSNVTFFDYGSESAHAIARTMNAGRNSQTKAVSIKTNSQGVIFEGELWFWSRKIGYAKGPLRLGTLCLLHHHLWSRAHDGRPVPRDHVVRFADSNPNNLQPENLRLVTRDQVCRENQARALADKARAFTGALLTRSQNTTAHETITHLRHASLRR